METPRHLRQKILHGTYALFPLIDTCWNQFEYIVSTFSPCGLDLATLFLVLSVWSHARNVVSDIFRFGKIQ